MRSFNLSFLYFFLKIIKGSLENFLLSLAVKKILYTNKMRISYDFICTCIRRHRHEKLNDTCIILLKKMY